MKNSDHEDISQTYRKWMLKIIFDKKEYYVVWGSDLSLADQEEKVLIDSKKKILLFCDKNTIKNFILSFEPLLFDSVNTTMWANGFAFDEEDVTQDLDYIAESLRELATTKLAEVNGEMSIAIVNFKNLFGDYAYQLNDEALIRLHRDESLMQFWDYMHNKNFWKLTEETNASNELTEAQFKMDQFVVAMHKLLHCFTRTCISII